MQISSLPEARSEIAVRIAPAGPERRIPARDIASDEPCIAHLRPRPDEIRTVLREGCTLLPEPFEHQLHTRH